MKHKLLTLLALVILTVALAVATARAQTVANGPYYAPPSWDQTLPVATRFIVLSNMNNEAVLDRETGLVWEQNPNTVGGTWAAAQHDNDFGCLVRTKGGRSGWRLPRLEEIQSLTIGAFNDLPAGHPFGANASGIFWTATTSAFSANRARVWGIGSATSTFSSVDKSELGPKTWCIRSPFPGFVGQ